jgi:SET domain-containing protein
MHKACTLLTEPLRMLYSLCCNACIVTVHHYYCLLLHHTLSILSGSQGSLARFVNHSCDPNCYTAIIAVDSVKKIIIYAKRSIAAGEELSYDYKFPIEERAEDRIACHCGAAKCRGFMN